MINLTVLGTAILAGITLLIGMSILIYQHYRFRRKSIDWGDLERYDTPLEGLPLGSNNSSFRSYKYSQLMAEQEGQRAKQQRRKFESVGNIERDRQTGGSRTSSKSCPPGVFTFPAQKRELDESSDQRSKFTLGIPSVVRNVEWNLQNFVSIAVDKEALESLRLRFHVDNTFDMPSKWFLYFKFNSSSEGDSIGVYLQVEGPSKVDKIPAKVKLLINSGIAGKDKSYGKTNVRDYKLESWGFPNVFSLAALTSPTSKLLPNRTLIIQLSLELYGNRIIEITDTKSKKLRLQSSSQSAACALDDISKLLESGLNSDLVITTGDLKVFKAHRCILAARSPVFRAMFAGDMLEQTTGQVEITDIGSKAMDILLKYCYSGRLESGWTEVAEEMIYSADKYDLPLLKDICDLELIDAVTPETAMDLLVIAKRHGLPTATADISLFIKDQIGLVLESFGSVREEKATNRALCLSTRCRKIFQKIHPQNHKHKK